MNYGNRSKLNRIASSPITLVIVIMLFAIVTRAAWTIHEKAVSGAAKLSQAAAELEKLQARQSDLTEKVAYLSTDNGIESEIRTRYRAVKPGESVAVIVDDSQTASADAADQSDMGQDSTSSAQATSTAPLGWWGRLLRKLSL